MALEFRPPEDLIQGYLSRPSPGQIASQGMNQAFQLYAQQKAAEQQKAALSRQAQLSEFNALAPYTERDQIPGLMQKFGVGQTAGVVPPTPSTGTVPSPTAGLPDAGGMPVTQAPSMTERWGSWKGSTSKVGMANYKDELGTQKLEKDLAIDPNAPVPVIEEGAAVKAGSVHPKARIVQLPGKKDTSIEDIRHEDRMAKAVTDYGKQIETHPVIKKLMDQQVGIDQVQELSGLVRDGNTVAASGMGTKMSKAMGEVGALTETDVRRYVQSGKLSQAAADTLSKWINGRPSDATMKEIGEISNVLQESFSSKIQPIYDRHIDRFSRAYKKTPDEAAHLLAIPYSGGKKQTVSAGKPSTFIKPGEEAEYEEYKRSMMGGK